jgi:signal transduction histidine kinase
VPAFFFSAPVLEQERPAGVVVVRQTTDAVGSLLTNRRTTSLIADSRGMVVATSHPEFYLRHISAADRDHLRQVSTVGSAPDINTLRSVYGRESLRTVDMARHTPAWNRRPVHRAERVIDGRSYLVTSDPIKAYAEYSLFVFSPIEWADNLRQLHLIIGALAALLGVLITFFAGRTVGNLARRRYDAEITAALTAKLTTANAEKDRYLGIAAHDLRNPLSSMRGLSELMLEAPLEPEQQREFLETIHRTSHEMLGLVNDLLDVSVIESGKLVLRRKDQDMAKLVQQRIRHLEPQARGKKIGLKVDVDGVREASIDPARFSQVIDNLVSNAIKFSPSGTEVQVGLRQEAGGFAFSVKDQGPGIGAEDQKLLFRSFQKLSARPTGGEKSTGLGLAIVKRIVDAHGGRIDVDSTLGAGTRFTVTVPTTAGK